MLCRLQSIQDTDRWTHIKFETKKNQRNKQKRHQKNLKIKQIKQRKTKQKTKTNTKIKANKKEGNWSFIHQRYTYSKCWFIYIKALGS